MVGMGLVKNKKVWCHLCSPQVINWRIDCTWFGNHPGSLPDRLFMLTFAAAVIDACGKEQVAGGSGDEQYGRLLDFSYAMLILFY